MRATIERLFERALEQVEAAPQLALLTQDHPLIRSATEYGDLFSRAVRHGAGNNGLRTATSDDVVTATRARGACATPASSGATSAPTASHTPTGDPTT